MKNLLFILALLFSIQSFSQGEKYEDGTRLKYRMHLLPFELSAEWITTDRLWSTKLSTGIGLNYFNVFYFDSEKSSTHVYSANPKIGLDFRKYFKSEKYRDFYGYYMEVSGRYFFPWLDNYDQHLWIAYHIGATWPIGKTAYINLAGGAGLYNTGSWGFGPTGTFGIGFDLN